MCGNLYYIFILTRNTFSFASPNSFKEHFWLVTEKVYSKKCLIFIPNIINSITPINILYILLNLLIQFLFQLRPSYFNI